MSPLRLPRAAVLAAALLVAIACSASAPAPAGARPDVSPSVQATAFGPGAGPTVAFKIASGADGDAVLARVEQALGAPVNGPLNKVGVFRVALEGEGPARSVSALRRIPGVAWAEPPLVVNALGAPNDQRYWEQYALGAMQVARAWEWSPGSASVTVAVVDSGVGPHADLDGRLLAGRSFLTGQAQGDTADRNGHGTAIAGIIAANVNNARGTAGVTQRVRILPVAVLDSEGVGNDQDTAEGMMWAVDQGADIINVSLGSQSPSRAMEEAVRYARSRGVVVVAAAGNDGAGVPVRYPAALPEVVAVGSVGQAGLHSSSSNAGPEVDVVAPGEAVLATDIPYHGIEGFDYRLFSGTSFAAAHVSGVAALLLSHDRGLSPAQVQRLLEEGAVDAGVAGRDPATGAGRADAARSVALAQGRDDLPGDVTAPRAPLSVKAAAGAGGQVEVQLEGATDPDRAGVQVRRTLTRPARTPQEGRLVADLPLASGVRLTVTDTEPPWSQDPSSTIAYYTAFTYDAAGNTSNPRWAFAWAPGAAPVDPPAPEPISFPDVSAGSPFAKAIESLAARDIVSGFPDGTFGPGRQVTRAQFAKMVVLALGIHPPESAAGMGATFADVPALDGYPFVYVEAAAQRDIIRGLGPGPDGRPRFGPDRPVTRVQVAQMLSRAGGFKLDLPPAGILLPFYDLPAYAEAEVRAPWEMGIVRGRGGTSFDPWTPATRGEVAAMVERLRLVLAARP